MQHVIEDFAGWIANQNGDVLAYEYLAKKYKSMSKADSVNQEQLNHLISRVRVFLELKHETTLINIRGKGYKLANAKELATTTAKWVKRTIMYADRTYRLVDITDRRLIPGALQEVFENSQKDIKHLSTRGKKFVQSFVEVYVKPKKELTNAKS